MKHGHYHRRSPLLWATYSGAIREFRWQNSWHQGPQYRQRFIVECCISFGGRFKTNGGGSFSKGVVLLQDNARSHTAACTNALTKLFTWEIFYHPPYSPDLAPSDYHLFPKMKVWLVTQHFHTNEELMDGVDNWLHNLAAPFYDEGLQKLVQWYDKCLNVDGNYVEKWCRYVCKCSI